MKKIILHVLLVTIAFTLSACGGKKFNNPMTKQTEQSEQITEQPYTKTELTVEGMSCNNCVNAVEKALSNLDGVIEVSVDLETSKAVIIHNADVSVEDIKECVMNVGYSPYD
jgi:copper ion binding protein